MEKPTGFIEYLREVAQEVAPVDRIRNWDEFHLPMPEENLRTQGARCMTSPVRFVLQKMPGTEQGRFFL